MSVTKNWVSVTTKVLLAAAESLNCALRGHGRGQKWSRVCTGLRVKKCCSA